MGEPVGERQDRARMQAVAQAQPPFARHLGVRITHVAPDRICGEMTVTPELTNRNGVLHGGAVMGLADNLGGTAASVTLRPGETTTTVESKTSFFRAVPAGQVLRAVCTALHKGRRTQIWQTQLFREDAKLAAQVIQTQMILPPE